MGVEENLLNADDLLKQIARTYADKAFLFFCLCKVWVAAVARVYRFGARSNIDNYFII